MQPLTEIAMQQINHVVTVLHPERFVEPVLLANLLCPLRRKRLARGEDQHRIARRQMDHEEREEGDADQHRHRLQQPPQDKTGHGTPLAISYRLSAISFWRVMS